MLALGPPTQTGLVESKIPSLPGVFFFINGMWFSSTLASDLPPVFINKEERNEPEICQ